MGYPISRATILYNKFSCYKHGAINREAQLLKDLSYTYFTVEKLNNKIKRQKMRHGNANDESIDDFYEEYKLEFKSIVKEITSIFNNQKYFVSFELKIQSYFVE